MTPLVSVVVINYNYAAFLATAIDSALAQDYPAVEVVVVDDGSIDHSAQVIAGYGDRVQAVMQANAGHTRAANTGYAATRGAYVVFLDADDRLDADFVAAMVAGAQAGDAKVQCRLRTIDAQGQDMGMPFPYFPPDFSPADVEREALVTGWHLWTVSSGNLYARAFLEQVMPIDAERIYCSPDGYFNKMAPLFGPVRSLDRVLGSYRVHGKNAWASLSENVAADGSVKVAQEWLRFNCALERAFVDGAARRGIRVALPLVHPFQKLEYEMLVARFSDAAARAELARAGVEVTRLGVLREGLRWLLRMRGDGLVGRLARMGWLVLLACAPRATVCALVSTARAQTGRRALWQKLLDLTRR